MNTRKALLFALSALIALSVILSACSPTVVTEVVEVKLTGEPIEVTKVVEVEGETKVITEVITATPEPEVPKGGDTLRFRLAEDPETLYNVNTVSITANGVMSQFLLERLVYIDGEGKAAPWLAESWDVSEDQLELTFKLRQGVKFHDGTEFNADAVKFHFDSVMDPDNASPLLPYFGSLQTVEVLDDYTVKFTFEEAYAPFFINIAGTYGGFNSPTAVQAAGDEYGRQPVGTGPYMLEEWIPGSEITLVRNPNYQQFRKDAVNQGAPLAEKIILTVIPEDGVAQAAMETGEILVTGLSADNVARFVGDPNFNVVVDQLATNLVFLEFNYQKEPWNDPAVRTAIGYAIDRQAAIQAAWSGYGSQAYSPLAVGIPGHDPAVAEEYGTPYDPTKAIEILTGLGWAYDEENNVMSDANGTPVEVLIKSYAGYNHIVRTLEVIQANLSDIGIVVELETADWGAFYPTLSETDDWDMDLMRWTWSDPAILTDLFRSPGHFGKRDAGPIDEVLDRCDATMDPDLRNQCVSEAQVLLLQDMAIVPILTNWAMFATQGYTRDYTIDFLGDLIPGDVWLDKE